MIKKKLLEAKNCGNCLYIKQGPSCCFCGHPKAYAANKEYVYWNFSCDKFKASPLTKIALARL